MNSQNFSTSITDRYFEDYVPGSVHEFGSITVTQDEILEYARKFDPQNFHADPEAAKHTIFGGIIASGFHTCGMMMRLYADHYLSRVASLSSPGVDEVRWTQPVRPGDELSIRVTVSEARRSVSKPDRGIVRTYIEVLNQRQEVVMTMSAMNLLACRNNTTQ